MKTYVITVATVFPKGHISQGTRTDFKKKILEGSKIHTIRANYDYWKERIDKINDGKGELSVRQWTGKPYHSNQKEFLKLHKVGIQKLDRTMLGWFIDDIDSDVTSLELAQNDGLTMEEFKSWFRGYKFEDLALIHFTDFRYPNSSTKII